MVLKRTKFAQLSPWEGMMVFTDLLFRLCELFVFVFSFYVSVDCPTTQRSCSKLKMFTYVHT